jgi:malate synthase
MATNPASALPAGLEVRGEMKPGFDSVLTPEALEFVVDLTRRFGDRVATLLTARAARPPARFANPSGA